MLKAMVRLSMLMVYVLFVTGCEQEGRGFSLPEGDAEIGRQVFEELACRSCHSFRDEVMQEQEQTIDRKLHVILGGKTSRVKTYGDLLTSVINPSHRIAYANVGEAADAEGQSNMENYNQRMTVQQLVDLVTYLQTTYTVIVPRTHYAVYP